MVDKINFSNHFKFNEHATAVNDRIAVVDFDDLEDVIIANPIFRENVHCFFLIENGSLKVEIGGFRKEVGAGYVISGVPGDIWIWDEHKDLKGKFIIFEASFPLAGLKGGFTLEPISYLNADSRYPFIRLSDKRFRRLVMLSDDMHECLRETPVHYDLLRSQMWEFIFYVEKEYIAQGKQLRSGRSANHVPEFINLVNKHFKTNHDSAFYADRLNITLNYLNKIVNETLGCNVRDYVMRRLISEAKILLRLTPTNVNEVAYALGFEDANYFIRLFKKSEGMTPGEYRKLGTL